MKLRYLFLGSLLLFSSTSFSDVYLRLSLMDGESIIDFEALHVSSTTTLMYDTSPYKVEGQLVSENNKTAEVWFAVFDDSELVMTETLQMYWQSIEVADVVYDSGGEDKTLQLVASPLYIGDNPTW